MYILRLGLIAACVIWVGGVIAWRQLDWSEHVVNTGFEKVEVGSSLLSTELESSGLKSRSRVATSDGFVHERFQPGILTPVCLYVVSVTNRIVHVSIRSMDRLDDVRKQKGIQIEHPKS